MTTKATATAPLILAIFVLVGGAIISAVVPTPVAYAEISDVVDTVDDTLERVGITEGEEEDTNNIEQQSIDQENDQELGQQVVDRSEHSGGTNTNIQIKSELDDQDIAQEIINGNDLGESSSESTQKANEQDADNGEELNHDEDETWIFGDDAVELEAANIAIPIAIPVM
jgi:hypothetical protein